MQVFDANYISKIPISLRNYIGKLPKAINPFLGIPYLRRESIIRAFESWSLEQRKAFIFNNIKKNVEYGYSKIQFYREFYTMNGFNPSRLRSFNDIQLIPSINKSILLEYPIEKRFSQIKNAVKVNTGGSSGHTLAFYRDKNAKNYHESVHMTNIWEKIGYKNSDLILVLIGANTVKGGIDFCFRSNSVRLDTYREFDQSAWKLKKIAKKTPIRFLQGYPSIIYEFALYCDTYDHDLRNLLKKSLKGAFLGSEYPHPVFRDKI